MEELSYKDAKILVVDDVEEVLKSTKNSLGFEGMDVHCINNPIEALEYLKENRVDVLLLDFFMPEINGDVFVKKLREFNNETIIILRTGYSDQVPPLQIIDNLNIQGYIDKLKGNDELILMTKAAIKTAFLTRAVKQKEEQIARLNYKSTVLGSLIPELVGDAESQVFSISGAVKLLENENIDEDLIRIISRANCNIESMFRALRFYSEKDVKVKEFEEIIKALLKAKSKLDCMHVKLSTEVGEVIIPGKIDNIIYSILEIYNYLKSQNETELNINTVIENGDVVITVIHNMDYPEEVIRKIKDLVYVDENIDIKCDNFLKIVVKNK